MQRAGGSSLIQPISWTKLEGGALRRRLPHPLDPGYPRDPRSNSNSQNFFCHAAQNFPKEQVKPTLMKTKSKISAYILRSSAAALLFSGMIVALSSAINVPNHPSKVSVPQNSTPLGVSGHESGSSAAASATRSNRTLTFADRAAYQRAIEDVYWRHRIWPAANAGP